MKSKKILLVAGEASGDLHGSHLVQAIQCIDPDIQFYGVGGEGLKRAGMRLLHHSQSLSVVGITEVFAKLGSILKALRALKGSLEREKPNLVILIDFPEFNLRLARIAHRKGIPILYYVSPQIWAWRPNRIKLIARLVKKMVVLFPFEVPLYEAAGVDVEWVGHPLLDIVKPTLSKEMAFKNLVWIPDEEPSAYSLEAESMKSKDFFLLSWPRRICSKKRSRIFNSSFLSPRVFPGQPCHPR